jgi:hypothetical protein
VLTNKGGTPWSCQGQRQIIPGLERELVGMRPGEEKKVVVAPDDGGYGPVVPGAQQEVPKDAIPKVGLKVGSQLTARSGSGEARPVTVKEIFGISRRGQTYVGRVIYVGLIGLILYEFWSFNIASTPGSELSTGCTQSLARSGTFLTSTTPPTLPSSQTLVDR